MQRGKEMASARETTGGVISESHQWPGESKGVSGAVTMSKVSSKAECLLSFRAASRKGITPSESVVRYVQDFFGVFPAFSVHKYILLDI